MKIGLHLQENVQIRQAGRCDATQGGGWEKHVQSGQIQIQIQIQKYKYKNVQIRQQRYNATRWWLQKHVQSVQIQIQKIQIQNVQIRQAAL